MGIQINGSTDRITAIDGTIDFVSNIGNIGLITASRYELLDSITIGAGSTIIKTVNGELGIGINAPARNLHVKSTTPYIRVESGAANQPATLELYHTRGNGSDKWPVSVATDDAALTFNVAAAANGTPAEKLRITSDGKVGINTTIPTATFETFHDGTSGYIFRGMADLGSNVRSYDLKPPSSDSQTEPFSWNTGNSHAFQVDGVERLRIDSSGRLLVNTTTNSISSNELFEVKSTSSGFSHFRNNSSTTAPIYIDNEYSDTGFAPLFTFTDGSGNRGGIGQDQNDLLRITGQGGLSLYSGGTHGGGTEKLRIDNNGRLLIGTQRTYSSQSWYDDITINNSNGSGQTGGTGISLISSSNSWNSIYFGDSDNESIGGIKYDHNTNSMRFVVNSIDPAVLIDSSGRVTIENGGSNLASEFDSGANQFVITHNGSCGLTIDATSSTSSSIHFADGPTGGESYRGIIEYNHSEDDMKFAVEATNIARLRKGAHSDVNGGMIIGNNTDNSSSAHSDSRTLVLGGTTHGETGMSFLNSTSGSGKIRFSDGTSPYNQGTIAYYHGTRTIGEISSYPESFSISPAQKGNQLVLNGNEAMRLSSGNAKHKMVDGFFEKAINTSFSTVFTIRSGSANSSPHYGYFYEIIVFGGDWGSHSANRVYFKGFINGYSGYGGHSVIEHSGTFGSNTGGQGHYGSDECQIQVVFGSNGDSEIQMRLNTGGVTATGYARFIGYIRDYDGFNIR